MTTSAHFRASSSLNRRQQAPPEAPSGTKTASQQAALRGASLAFLKPPAGAKPLANTYSGSNGARAAAARADTGSARSRAVDSAESTRRTAEVSFSQPAAAGVAPLVAAQQSVVRGHDREALRRDQSVSSELGRSGASALSPSPSSIAANLAAARLTPQSSGGPHRKPSVSPAPRGSANELEKRMQGNRAVDGNIGTIGDGLDRSSRSPIENSMVSYKAGTSRSRDAPDSTSIAPTASLIGMFEQDIPDIEPRKSTLKHTKRSTAAAPLIQSPQPVRPLSSGNASLTAALAPDQETSHAKLGSARSPPTLSKRSDLLTSSSPSASYNVHHSENDWSLSPASLKSSKPASESVRLVERMHQSPKQNEKAAFIPSNVRSIASQQPAEGSVSLKEGMTPSPSAVRAVRAESSPILKQKPDLPPPRRKINRSNEPGISKTFDQSQSSTDDNQHRPRLRKEARHSSGPSWKEELRPSNTGERRTRRSPHSMSSALTEHTLADAIVASSLASSRAPSPTKSPAPLLPQRQSKGHLHFLHHSHNTDSQLSRTPSPSKGMRHTMRKPAKSDDEAEASKKSRKLFAKKHPNKHHEGDRKRWRDAVTERERKRYEGVWAANKDLPLSAVGPRSPMPAPEGRVPNFVVRDLWSRSRLNLEVLEEIWDLVDRQGVGALSREEYVVGMWLVDQRLKGRKLPVKISASVWDSVRQLSGVKVPRRKK
ncbi:MAG: Increased rDNA silencing protein [Chaenotheca gracillima]|nr:MAG: Increased rDNA silencing protein [Chaenotheca gracillima]